MQPCAILAQAPSPCVSAILVSFGQHRRSEPAPQRRGNVERLSQAIGKDGGWGGLLESAGSAGCSSSSS
eukprot:13213520-Heterocapsa_arctica.AAC.1